MKVQKKNKGHTKEKLWQHELSSLVVEFFDNVIKYLTKKLKARSYFGSISEVLIYEGAVSVAFRLVS